MRLSLVCLIDLGFDVALLLLIFFLVFDDADIEKAIEGLMAAKFRASGQTCVCANRIYVQEGIHDRFLERFAQVVSKRMISGDPLVEETTLGPLINAKATEKVVRLVQDACENGAEAVIGGVRSGKEAATFYPATILKGMKPSMQASREEWFGPVVAFYKFGSEQELLSMANDSEVGLAAYVYTATLSQAWRAAELLQTGMVGINTGVISDPVAPFGGVKQSGFGREGGRVGIEEFQNMKVRYILIYADKGICANLLDHHTRGAGSSRWNYIVRNTSYTKWTIWNILECTCYNKLGVENKNSYSTDISKLPLEIRGPCSATARPKIAPLY